MAVDYFFPQEFGQIIIQSFFDPINLYTKCRIYVSDGDILFWKENAVNPKLTIDSVRDVLLVFVNGQLIGN